MQKRRVRKDNPRRRGKRVINNSRNKRKKQNFNRHSKIRKKRLSTFKKIDRFTKKYPLWTSIILLISSIILFRLSFINSFLNQPEIFMWSIFLSIGLFIAGILVLKAYWKNNVSILTTKHSVNWKNH